MSLGERLKIFAKENNNSLSKLSSQIGIAYPQLNRYANNLVEPGADVLKKLAEAGCDINWLLTGKAFSSTNIGQGFLSDRTEFKKNKSIHFGPGAPEQENESGTINANQELRLMRQIVRLEDENTKLKTDNAKLTNDIVALNEQIDKLQGELREFQKRKPGEDI